MFFGIGKKKHQKLPFKTDIHCHVVPGIDDGSESVEKSVMLLQHMQQWGLECVIPTPHVTEDTFENIPTTIDPAYEALVVGVRDAGLDLKLMPPSAEYRIDSFFVDCLGKGIVRPMPGNHLLVENSFVQEPWGLDDTLYNLILDGYNPILAHPERYLYYHGDFDRYVKLHASGVLFQCNLLSIGGYYGKEIKKIAQRMIDENLVDFIGTDVHGMRHVEFIEHYMGTSHFGKVSAALAGRLLNDKLSDNGQVKTNQNGKEL